jgi:hypothetical protein
MKVFWEELIAKVWHPNGAMFKYYLEEHAMDSNVHRFKRGYKGLLGYMETQIDLHLYIIAMLLYT